MAKELVTYTEVQKTLSREINDAYTAANEHARKAVKDYLIVGGLLQDMRDLFPGDKEFGRWRMDNTAIGKQWAAKLMKAYGTYKLSPPVKLPISTLMELSYVSDDKREELEAQAADPDQKNPSVRDVKEVAKKEKVQHIDIDEKPEVEPKAEDLDTTEYVMLTVTAVQAQQIICDLTECGHDELAKQLAEDM